MLLEENQIAFHSDDEAVVDEVKDYSHLISELIGLGSDTELLQAGVSLGLLYAHLTLTLSPTCCLRAIISCLVAILFSTFVKSSNHILV